MKRLVVIVGLSLSFMSFAVDADAVANFQKVRGFLQQVEAKIVAKRKSMALPDAAGQSSFTHEVVDGVEWAPAFNIVVILDTEISKFTSANKKTPAVLDELYRQLALWPYYDATLEPLHKLQSELKQINRDLQVHQGTPIETNLQAQKAALSTRIRNLETSMRTRLDERLAGGYGEIEFPLSNYANFRQDHKNVLAVQTYFAKKALDYFSVRADLIAGTRKAEFSDAAARYQSFLSLFVDNQNIVPQDAGNRRICDLAQVIAVGWPPAERQAMARNGAALLVEFRDPWAPSAASIPTDPPKKLGHVAGAEKKEIPAIFADIVKAIAADGLTPSPESTDASNSRFYRAMNIIDRTLAKADESGAIRNSFEFQKYILHAMMSQDGFPLTPKHFGGDLQAYYMVRAFLTKDALDRLAPYTSEVEWYGEILAQTANHEHMPSAEGASPTEFADYAFAILHEHPPEPLLRPAAASMADQRRSTAAEAFAAAVSKSLEHHPAFLTGAREGEIVDAFQQLRPKIENLPVGRSAPGCGRRIRKTLRTRDPEKR